jgi:Xaa-Pro aminopeptidase
LCRPPADASTLRQFLEKLKGSDGGEHADALLALARGLGAPLGALLREKPDGGLSTLWHERTVGVEQVDVASALARLMAPKDEAELLAIKRAAHLSAAVLEKFVVSKIEAVVVKEGKARERKTSSVAQG